MPYCIKVATSPTELDAVMRLRYDVFVVERGFMPERHDRRVYDHYDVLPTTANLLAQVDGQPVGTLRFTAPSEAGTSPDSYFDFAPHLPVAPIHVGALSQMVIRGGVRQGAEIAFSLLGLSYCLAVDAGPRYLEAIVNPDALARMFVSSGWVAASAEFTDHSGLRCLPLTLDLDALHPRFKDFVAEHRAPTLRGGAEYRFYTRNESILGSGEPSGDALQVVKARLRSGRTAEMNSGSSIPGSASTRAPSGAAPSRSRPPMSPCWSLRKNSREPAATASTSRARDGTRVRLLDRSGSG